MEVLEALPSISKLSKTVTRILGQNPGKFTLQGTNTYLLGERNPYILIDTGEGKDEYIPLLQSALLDPTREHDPTGPHISDIILTHRHHDHTNGLPSVLALLRRLWESSAPTSAPSTAPTPFHPPQIHKIPLTPPNAQLSALLASLQPDSYAPSPSGAALHDLAEGDTLSVTGGGELRVLHTPGHTPDSLCLYYPADRALFTADTVLGHGTAVFEDLGSYMRSLQRMVDFSSGGTYETVYPGHGRVVPDGHAKVETYLKHRVQREEQIVRVLEHPPLAGEGWTVEAIVGTVYAQYPKELWGPAGHSVELHLRKLEGDGRVEQVADGWVLVHAGSG